VSERVRCSAQTRKTGAALLTCWVGPILARGLR